MRIFSLLLLVFSTTAHAAIFDAGDFLPAEAVTLGAFGEIILNNPAGEGAEARARYGLSDDMNVGAFLGTGSKNRRFRFGAEGVYNFIPDWEGQLGISALATAMYLKRETSSGVQLRVAPLLHKKVEALNGNPATLFLSLPYYLEARSGSLTSASQLVLGAVFDVNREGRWYLASEAGLKLSRSESYVLLGGGYRFGELKLRRRLDDSDAEEDREFRSEDFQ